MSAINQNHLYGGAIYKGHNLNGIMPFNQILFAHSNHITIHYIDATSNSIITTRSINLEYNHDDNINIFYLPYMQENSYLDNYTDQYMKANLSSPSITLGISSITSYNNRINIDYQIAPVKTQGVIYVNYIYNQLILKQDKITGVIGGNYQEDLSIPSDYQLAAGSPTLNNINFTYQPQYKNILVEKVSD